jgi:hypothetical protein
MHRRIDDECDVGVPEEDPMRVMEDVRKTDIEDKGCGRGGAHTCEP